MSSSGIGNAIAETTVIDPGLDLTVEAVTMHTVTLEWTPMSVTVQSILTEISALKTMLDTIKNQFDKAKITMSSAAIDMDGAINQADTALVKILADVGSLNVAMESSDKIFVSE